MSQAMDARLAWYQRLAVRFHLLYCVWCRRYAAQIQFLRKAAKGLATTADTSSLKLPEDAKEQLCKRLQEALKDSTPPPR